MYIAEVRLHNFRSYRDACVRLSPGINVVVGPNNAGKSNLLAGLNLLFGERFPRRTDLAHRDFHLSAEQSDGVSLLGIAARLAGTSNDLRPGEDWGAYSETWSPHPGTGEIRIPWSDDWWNALSAPLDAGRRWLGPHDLESAIGRAVTSGEVWAYVVCERDESGEMELGFLIKSDEGWIRLSRVRGAVRDGVITAAYLPAFRSPAESLRISDWTWYGKLVRKLYQSERDRNQARFTKAEAEISDLVQGAFTSPTDWIRGLLAPLVPTVDVSFKAGPFTVDRAHEAVTLFVNDGVESPVAEKGAGLQSLLVIALFELYCKLFHESGTALLLEEPENYLHPHGRRALVAALRRFVQEDETRRQIIVTTHSENLVRAADVGGLKVVRKGPTGSKFWALPTQHEHRDRWQQILRRSPEVVFAEHAILVEGAEEYLVPSLADYVVGSSGVRGVLDRRNVSVIRVEGKANFKAHVTLLEKLGIGWTILTDQDFLASGATQFLPPDALGASDDHKIAAFKKIGVFVNPRGDLEGLYTERGQKLVQEQRSKDRAALEIAQKIEAGDSVDDWLGNIEPIRDAVLHALDKVGWQTGG